jgi:hypothetical protein
MESYYRTRTPPYTTAEKQWLRANYGGEFHLLRCYSLSIYDEADREEGRLIARGMMDADNRPPFY